MMDPKNIRVLITGCGHKKKEFEFHNITTGKPSHNPIFIEGVEYKLNIGAATALVLARAGFTVHMVARSEEKLKNLQTFIRSQVPQTDIEYTPVDLGNLTQLQQWIDSLSSDKLLWWVQSVGLDAGTVQLKDDNPYLLIDDITEELIEAELSVVKNTILVLQRLLPRFRKQKETRVCVISSMSAIRSVWSGSMHMAAKGAMSRFANAAMIELDKEKIYISSIRPGGVDTGMYDKEAVRDRIEKIAATYDTDWSQQNGGLRLAPPISVGQTIHTALTSQAYITSINLVACGQWPHEGS